MTIGELKSLIRSLVGDALNYTPNSTASFSAQTYSDVQLNAAIAHSFKLYATFTDKLYKEYTGITLADGFADMPPSDMGILHCLYGGVDLVRSDVKFEYMKNPSWQNVTGIPTRFVEFDGARVRIIPKPTSGGTVSIGVVDIPAVGADGAQIDSRITEVHHDHLKLPAAAYLLTLQGDQQNVALADNYVQQFRNLIQEK